MSPTRSASVRSGGGRAVLTALVVVGVAVGMTLLIRARPGVEAFDPRSDRGDGASAAVQLLEEYGATVSITSHAPLAGDSERVLVIADRLNDAQHRELLDFVDAGGIAVVADPGSELPGGAGLDNGATEVSDDPPGAFNGGRLDAIDEANIVTGDCTIDALRGLRGVFTPDGLLFPTSAGQDHCFGHGGQSFVIVRRHGAGSIVGFGDNRLVTNQYLRYADNAGLLTALLAPSTGAHVRIMLGTAARPSPGDVGHGSETLADIVSPGVWMGLTQLALAFVVLCIARGVRPGRAVREPAATPIAGNELVVATGNLMQRAHHFGHAAHLICDDFYRELCEHHRLPIGTPVDSLAGVVASRSGIDQAVLAEVLYRPVGDSDALVHLRDDIDSLRRRTILEDAPAGNPSPGPTTPAQRQNARETV